MDGAIDWQALPILIELYAIADPEILILQLHAIREHLRLKSQNA